MSVNEDARTLYEATATILAYWTQTGVSYDDYKQAVINIYGNWRVLVLLVASIAAICMSIIIVETTIQVLLLRKSIRQLMYERLSVKDCSSQLFTSLRACQIDASALADFATSK